jgi:lipopolysaccharide/colanic/teichoic acid biosynthesis glycosyltransferase
MIYTHRINTVTAEEVVRFSLYDILKRVFDFSFAFLMIILLFPFFVITCIIIYLETGNSPIFIQFRGITLEQPEFKIFKFRTLKKSTQVPQEIPQIFIRENLSGLVTRSGHLLRKTGLDELPQLINILAGEMSFIGPRPLSNQDLQLMRNQKPYLYNRRSKIKSKPGISGYWQIYGNRLDGIQNLIELDEYYENNKSFLFDLFLIFMTIPIVLFAKHTDAIIGKKQK